MKKRKVPLKQKEQLFQVALSLVEGEGFEPSKPKQRIYSPSHLTALEPLQQFFSFVENTANIGIIALIIKLFFHSPPKSKGINQLIF